MMEANLHGQLNIRQLSPIFRWGYWTRNKQEPDASILWPGIRQQIGQWIASESPIVTAALTRSSDPIVASRVIFSRSQTQRNLWYYGYFYTLPNFRRMGLGEQVMRKGLAAIKLAGGRYCSCYVAENNQASAELATKLGFYKLPFVRVVFRAVEKHGIRDIKIRSSECMNTSFLPTVINFVDRVVGGNEGAAVITDELNIRQPWQPWKAIESKIVYLARKNDIYIAVGRTGIHKSVLLPDPNLISSDPVVITLSAVSALRGNAEKPIFTFIPDIIAKEIKSDKNKTECEIFHIYWHNNIQAIFY